MSTKPERPRVLIIGLDGATFRLIKPLSAAGQLPNLTRIMQAGVSGTLRSSIQPSSEQAWATFMTGQNNGRHGVYGFQQRVPGTYHFAFVNGRHIRVPTIWQRLSQRGREVIAVNVPMTYPPQPVRGVVVGGLLSPGVGSDFTYPPRLYEELRRACGDYVIDVDIERGRLGDPQLAQLAEAAVRMIRLRTCATLHLARTRPWDCLMTVYGASDRLAHKFWKYWDPRHPLHTPQLAAAFGDVLPRLYRELDAAVGELVAELADDDTTVFILSDHGFGGMEKAVYLNRWLARQGYLVLHDDGSRGLAQRGQLALRAGLRRAVGLLDIEALARVKKWAFGRFPGLKGSLYSSVAFAQVDWPRTRAYALGNMGNIYLNLQGREPQGAVKPGPEAEGLIGQLAADLAALLDPDTGQPVFEQVYRGPELYRGPHAGAGPDVVGVKDCRYHVVTADWQGGDEIVASLAEGMHFVSDQSGQHDLDGVLLAQGPGIRGSGSNVDGARLIDMAATILYALGEAAPVDLDSQLLTDLFEPAWLEAHPPRRTSTDQAELVGDAGADPGYSADEEATIREHLAGLGYLD